MFVQLRYSFRNIAISPMCNALYIHNVNLTRIPGVLSTQWDCSPKRVKIPHPLWDDFPPDFVEKQEKGAFRRDLVEIRRPSYLLLVMIVLPSTPLSHVTIMCGPEGSGIYN